MEPEAHPLRLLPADSPLNINNNIFFSSPGVNVTGATMLQALEIPRVNHQPQIPLIFT
jgi:hypothetical protein